VFDTLSTKLEAALDKVKGRGRLDEKTVDATLKEIRLALLEADVNFKVVKGIVERLREQLVGEEVAKALNPSQTGHQGGRRELTRALGGESATLDLKGRRRRSSCWPGCRAPGRRPRPASSPSCSRARAATRCWSPATCSVRPRSSS
jgi:signal recognition particle subunit SRP54